MGLSHFPQGVSSFGMPVIGSGGVMTTGSVFFVDSGAANATTGNIGSKEAPMSTIASAIDKTTANNGDVIFVMPGHAETLTAALALDVAGVRIVGIGWGRSRPAITANFAAGGDTISVTAANCVLENTRLAASSATQTAQINIAAADFQCINCVIEQGANNLIGVTAASGSDRFAFDGCQFIGTAAGPDVGIDIETGDVADWAVRDCDFNYAGSSGLDLAGIRASFQQTGGIVTGNNFIAMDVTAVDINSSVSAQGDGIIAYNNVVGGAAIANIDTAIDAGGYGLIENYGTDSATASGGLIPVATPA